MTKVYINITNKGIESMNTYAYQCNMNYSLYKVDAYINYQHESKSYNHRKILHITLCKAAIIMD